MPRIMQPREFDASCRRTNAVKWPHQLRTLSDGPRSTQPGILHHPCHSERSEESVSPVKVRILRPVPGLRMTGRGIPAPGERNGSSCTRGSLAGKPLAHTQAAIAALVGTKSDASGAEFPRLHDAWPVPEFRTNPPRRQRLTTRQLPHDVRSPPHGGSGGRSPRRAFAPFPRWKGARRRRSKGKSAPLRLRLRRRLHPLPSLCPSA